MLARKITFCFLLSFLAPVLFAQAPEPPPSQGFEIDQEEEAVQRAEREKERLEEGVRFRRLNAPVIFADFFLKTNEAVRDLVVIGGNADIEGIVEGSLVLIGGRARISGVVEQETVIVLGGAEITEDAILEREVVLIGGPFSISGGADFSRELTEIAFGDVVEKIEWFKQWLFQGLFYGRLLPPGITWPWVVAAMFAFVYLGLLLVFPSAVKGTMEAIEHRPVTSIAVGMLTMVLVAPLTVLLAVSVVGVAVIPFLKLGFILLALFGKAGLLCFLGRSAGRSMRAGFMEQMLPAFIAGVALMTVAYMLPVLGVLAWAVGSVFGLGAAVVALSSTFQKEETSPPAPVRIRQPHTEAVRAGSSAAGGSSAMAMPEPPLAIAPGDTLLLPRAGFWRRLGAALLDWVLLVFFIPLLEQYTILLAVTYFVAMWTWKGTTIGGIVLGLKVVCTNGEPVNFVVALVRSLSSVFSGVCGFLGFFWAGWDREKQSWHDKIAGTVVVRMPRDFALI